MGGGLEGGVHKVQRVSHRGCHHGDLASECCGRRPGLQRKRREPVASAAARELANTITQQGGILAVFLYTHKVTTQPVHITWYNMVSKKIHRLREECGV